MIQKLTTPFVILFGLIPFEFPIAQKKFVVVPYYILLLLFGLISLGSRTKSAEAPPVAGNNRFVLTSLALYFVVGFAELASSIMHAVELKPVIFEFIFGFVV